MSKTYIADKDTLDAVNGKIGTKDDVPSPNPISLFAGIKQLLKSLSDHMSSWTSARAAKVDYLDTTVGSRAPANTALSTAQWTNARAGYLDKLNNSSYGLEAIKNAVNKKEIGSAILVGSGVSSTSGSGKLIDVNGKGVAFISGNGGYSGRFVDITVDGKKIGEKIEVPSITLQVEFSKSIAVDSVGSSSVIAAYVLY